MPGAAILITYFTGFTNELKYKLWLRLTVWCDYHSIFIDFHLVKFTKLYIVKGELVLHYFLKEVMLITLRKFISNHKYSRF